MNYGRFNKESTEFIIERPDTPVPWFNFLTNGSYTAVISQVGEGFSFYKDFLLNRFLAWDSSTRHAQKYGRYIYIRDKSTKNVFSPTYQPVCSDFSTYKARHGIGYTIISSLSAHIESEITYFVPLHEACEVWFIKLTNRSGKLKNLQIYPFCEIESGSVRSSFNRVWYNKRTQSINAVKQFSNSILFCHSTLPIKGYAVRRASFMGRNNSLEKPESVFSGVWNNSPLAVGESGIAAFYHELSLPPKKSKLFSVIIGRAEKTQEIQQIIKKYRSTPKTHKELAGVKEYWKNKITANIHVDTPDTELNTLVNTWLKYQIIINNNIPRSADSPAGQSLSFEYASACLNSEALVPFDADSARKRIVFLAKFIRLDGTTAPGWSDPETPSSLMPNKSDTVWLTSAVSSYIKETGDNEILKEKIPYLKDTFIKGWTRDHEFTGDPVFVGEETLYEHLWRNLEFTFKDIDESGLPRIGYGDWNGSLDSAGFQHKGGSVWTAQALVRSLKILARLSDLINEREKATELRRRATSMTERIEQFWDGEWYQRGITDEGMVFGSSKNNEGKIYAMTQSWAVIAGIAQGERLHKLLKSVDKYLDGSHGYALLHPAYTEYDQNLGSITLLPAGIKDNGSVMSCAALWMILADCCAGRGDKAYESLRKIMPCAQKDGDVYKAEPYVCAGYIKGPDHPYAYGEGSHAWLNVAAGIMFNTVLEWILGIRPELNGLLIDPCIPKHWKKFYVKRHFRGNLYDITVENPHGVEKRIKEITVNGEKIRGNLIMVRENNKKITVRVIMGAVSSKLAKKEKAVAAI